MSRASIINALQACIDDSNDTTGRTDTNVTDCVNRLIRGYSGGSSNIVGEINSVGDGTNYFAIPCTEEPDAVIIYASGWTFSDTTPAPLGYVAVKNHFTIGVRCNDSGNMASYLPAIMSTDYPWGNAGGNGMVGGTYENGQFTARSRGTGSFNWSASYSYHGVAIKL